jgi:hypothetical protein
MFTSFLRVLKGNATCGSAQKGFSVDIVSHDGDDVDDVVVEHDIQSDEDLRADSMPCCQSSGIARERGYRVVSCTRCAAGSTSERGDSKLLSVRGAPRDVSTLS